MFNWTGCEVNDQIAKVLKDGLLDTIKVSSINFNRSKRTDFNFFLKTFKLFRVHLAVTREHRKFMRQIMTD